MTKKVSMAHAKAALSELASRASAGERIMLVRRGKPLAALVGTKDLEILESRSAGTGFVEALNAFRERHHDSLPAAPLRVRRSKSRTVR
jgi:prevent-host-death family protein